MKKMRPVEKLYKVIAVAQDKINSIRQKCKHKKTHMGNYSYRFGSIFQTELCNACDAVIANSTETFDNFQITFSPNVDNSNSATILNLTGKCCDNGNFEKRHNCQKSNGDKK